MQKKIKPFGVVIMGPSGVGKTTVAKLLQSKTNWSYIEGDEFHPKTNKDKMAKGIPLDDNDRFPWLELLKNFIDNNAKNGVNTIITCSALKYFYRNILRETKNSDIFFCELYGGKDVVLDRISTRKHDFMPLTLLESQYEILEELKNNEKGFRYSILLSPDEITNKIINNLS